MRGIGAKTFGWTATPMILELIGLVRKGFDSLLKSYSGNGRWDIEFQETVFASGIPNLVVELVRHQYLLSGKYYEVDIRYQWLVGTGREKGVENPPVLKEGTLYDQSRPEGAKAVANMILTEMDQIMLSRVKVS